jgi:CRISPR system Cascade subunit CasD
MADYLVFRLYGPMASWGEIAVGEVRPSSSYPSRSAILGLICAALGIKRNEEEQLSAISEGYDVAIKVISHGSLLNDYHTIQAPASARATSYATRKEELSVSKDNLETMLTSREYRCDALSLVALRPRMGAPLPLFDLMNALERPCFVLYLGRKSCPQSLPFSAQIVSSSNFRDALDAAIFPPLISDFSGRDVMERYLQPSGGEYYWEGEDDQGNVQETRYRYDKSLNRHRWQFESRKEYHSSTGGNT